MFTAEAGLSGASLNFFKIIFSLSGVTRGFFRACIRLHGSPLWTQEEQESHSVGFYFFRLFLNPA